MKRTTPLAVVCATVVAAVTLAPATAQADMVVSYYMDSAFLNYTNNTMNLTIEEGIGSSIFELYLNNTDLFSVVDSSTLSTAGSFDLLVDLGLVRNGANDYSATGTFEVVDGSGTTAILADFTSTEISLTNGELEIRGRLLGQGAPGSSILVNKGEPWVFEGDAEHPGLTQGPNLTVNNAGAYDNGVLTTVSFGLGGVTLDGFFNDGLDRQLVQGTVQGQIAAPLPGALILGALGLGLVCWMKRRFA